MSSDPDRAVKIAEFYRDTFPGRFFFELMDHGIPDQAPANRRLIELSRAMSIPVVATNDCHFLRPDDRYLQDVMLCIQTGKRLTDTDRMAAYTPNHYLKSPSEMAAVFSSIPEAISNTGRIAGNMVTFDPPLDAFHFRNSSRPTAPRPKISSA